MPRPTPTQLDQQAAELRDRAAALDRVHNRETVRIGTELGQKLDDARLAARTARASAEVATKEADDLQDKAKEFSGIARDMEKGAVGNPRTPGSDYDHGDNMRDNAQLVRSQVTVYTRRAEQAQRAAREQFDRAEAAEREAERLERAESDSRAPLHDLKLAGDDLETKAAALEEAANTLRQVRSVLPADRQKLLDEADRSIARSEAITPVDVSGLDPRIFIDAGVPLTEVPGAELMDPFTQSTSPRAAIDGPPGPDAVAGAPLDDPVDPTGAEPVAAAVLDPLTGLALGPGPAADLADPVGTDLGAAPVDDIGPAAAASDLADPVADRVSALDEPATEFAPTDGGDQYAEEPAATPYEYET